MQEETTNKGGRPRKAYPSSENSRNVTFEPEILALVDRMADADKRPRSYVIMRLLESHPEILRLRAMGGGVAA